MRTTHQDVGRRVVPSRGLSRQQCLGNLFHVFWSSGSNTIRSKFCPVCPAGRNYGNEESIVIHGDLAITCLGQHCWCCPVLAVPGLCRVPSSGAPKSISTTRISQRCAQGWNIVDPQLWEIWLQEMVSRPLCRVRNTNGRYGYRFHNIWLFRRILSNSFQPVWLTTHHSRNKVGIGYGGRGPFCLWDNYVAFPSRDQCEENGSLIKRYLSIPGCLSR